MNAARFRNVLPVALRFVALAGISIDAGAALTVVNPLGQGTGAERCLEGASCPTGGTYGGKPSLISIFAADLGPGNSLVRVNDSFDTMWHNISGNSGRIAAVARYAGDTSTLGYDKGTGFIPLLGAVPNTKEVLVSGAHLATLKAADPTHAADYKAITAAPVTIFASTSQPFAFVLDDLKTNTMWTSNNTSGGPGSSSAYANSINGPTGPGIRATAGQDHMVTYRVFNEGVAQKDYFIAWEDHTLNAGLGGDHDYNDYVAEVKYVAAIPEPETYAMLLAGLGLMGFVARRRRNRLA